MNIPIFGFLLNAATRWTPRTSQNIAEKPRYPRSNILFRIFQVFFKKPLISVEHKIFPNSRGLIEFSRIHSTPRNVKYINRVVAQKSPKFCCSVLHKANVGIIIFQGGHMFTSHDGVFSSKWGRSVGTVIIGNVWSVSHSQHLGPLANIFELIFCVSHTCWYQIWRIFPNFGFTLLSKQSLVQQDHQTSRINKVRDHLTS